ncbi:MAG: hypothetical protein ABIS06_12650 [Vicinamibacterales bacterium]
MANTPARQRRTTLRLASAASRVRQLLASELVRRVVPLAIISRIAILAVGFATVAVVGYQLQPGQFRVSRNEFLNLPARGDAGWYLGIARHGYRWSPELHGHRHALAFFPAYPILMRVAGEVVTLPAKVIRDPDLLGNGDSRVLWGGVLTSITCFIAALAVVYRIAQHPAVSAPPLATLTLLAFYPFGLFFGVAYSESLFLFVMSATVLAWLYGHKGAAFGCGLLTGLARSNGWTLSVALLAALVLRDGSIRRHRCWWLIACAPGIGACGFSAYVWWVTGSPLEWVTAQEGWGRAVSPVAFATRRIEALSELGPWGYLRADPVDAATALAVALSIATTAWHLRRRHVLFGTLILAYLAPALIIDLPATGRMTSVLFPVFLCAADILRGWRLVAVACAFAAGQLLLAARHFLWLPPY